MKLSDSARQSKGSTNNGQPSPTGVVSQFLQTRFGQAPPDHFILIWTLKVVVEGETRRETKCSSWLKVGQLRDAPLAMFCDPEVGNAYVGVGLSTEDFGPWKRCEADKISGIVGLWADVDIKGPAHKQEELPETMDQTKELILSLGLAPTEVIHSGHGLQPWWLFEQPWIFRDDQNRARAQALALRFQVELQKRGRERGWELDSTQDLARLLRLPGSWNCKPGCESVQVTVLESGGPRYDPGDFEAFLPFEPPKAAQKTVLTVRAGASVAERARAYVQKMPAAISGQRGHRAAWAVAQVLVRGFSLSVEEARPIMAAYSDRCAPPWSDKEIDHKLTSAKAKSRLPDGYLLNRNPSHHAGERVQGLAKGSEAGQPWDKPVPLAEAPEVAPFPLHVFPEPLQQYATEVAWAMNCPTDYVAILALAIAGGCIANSHHLSITRTHQQWAALYAGIVGSPGAVKSPVLKLIRKPLDAAQERYHDFWRRQMDAWEEKDKTDRGPLPVMRRCVVSDITTESLCLLLHENPRGFIMLKDELSGLMAGMNQYKNGNGHDRQIYLQLWAGDTVLVDRKSDRTGEPLYVSNPFFAIAGCIQPAVLDRLRGKSFRGGPPPDDGFLDRFLLSCPNEPPAVGEQWREVADDTLEAWEKVVSYLLGLEMVDREGDRPRPYFVSLTIDGRAAWKRFTDALAKEVNAEDFPEHLKGTWSKLRAYAGRLALILSTIDLACEGADPAGQQVSGRDVESASQLIYYFKSHARKVHHLMDADPRIAGARRVLRCLARNPDLENFTRRDVYQHLRRHFKTPRSPGCTAPAPGRSPFPSPDPAGKGR